MEVVCFFKDNKTKLELELTDLQNVEEPQSEDLRPLVCTERSTTIAPDLLHPSSNTFHRKIWKSSRLFHRRIPTLPQEEDLQDIEERIATKCAECDQAREQMARDKASLAEAEQEYQQHKASISSVAEEADAKKVANTPELSGREALETLKLINTSGSALQEELSKTDQEVMKSKHHKKHYEDKRTAHLQGIQTLEAAVQSDEQELQVLSPPLSLAGGCDAFVKKKRQSTSCS